MSELALTAGYSYPGLSWGLRLGWLTHQNGSHRRLASARRSLYQRDGAFKSCQSNLV